MLTDLLQEKQCVWEHLSQTNKPIFLYGMGDGADKVIAALSLWGKAPDGIFASDDFVRGHSFHGMKVRRYSEVKAEYGSDFIALLCFGINYEPMLSILRQMDRECEFYAPDVPVIAANEGLFDLSFFHQHIAELTNVYTHLADETSRRTFLALLNYKLSGKLRYLDEIFTPPEEAWQTILHPGKQDVFLDLGAFNGDTAKEFFTQAGGCEKIIAMEPDAKNYARLVKTLEEMAVPFEAIPAAAWDAEGVFYLKGGRGGRNAIVCPADVPGCRAVQTDSVDHLLQDAAVDILKMDVEGAEAKALLGAQHTIRQYAPKLIVSAYHRREDLFAIPQQILSYRSDYRLFLRQRPYFPPWDTNYYCIM